MKDGEIWAIEFNDGKKWHMVATFYRKGHAKASVKSHYLKFDGDKENYRVEKYVRQEAK